MLMLLIASGMLVMPGKVSFLCSYSLGFFMPFFLSYFMYLVYLLS
jgi:hypothetical protein